MKKKYKVKVLVTGGAGMIGSNLVKRLVYEGFDVFVATNTSNPSYTSLFTKFDPIIPAPPVTKTLTLYFFFIFIIFI